MKFILLISFILLVLSCEKPTQNENFSYYREDGLMKDEFYGKGDESDIPSVFEMVSVDKNGNVDGKGADTHFSFLDEEVGISYYYYENQAEALKHFENDIKKARKVVRKGIIKSEGGEEVGKKALLLETTKETRNNYYTLIWTRNSRWTSLSSESLKAIEAYEKDRNL